MERSFVLLFLMGTVLEGSAFCDPGYHSTSNGSCISDINKCDNWGTCSQICISLNGGFKCDCAEGYSLDPAGQISCKATGERPTMLVAHHNGISMLSMPDSKIIHDLKYQPGSNEAVGLDFLWKDTHIFWSEISGNASVVKSASVDDFLNQKQLLAPDVNASIESLAVDWIHDNLYWTDGEKATISVMTLKESFSKTLVLSEIYKPRALALNPLAGWMYWTDWGTTPSSVIERAGMDGSRREIIVRDLSWPNGITIDFTLARLFWVDATSDVLESSTFDGSDRRLIPQKVLRHPFSVTTFEDFAYVSDWTAKSVWKINKFTGGAIGRVFNSTNTVNTVQIYHQLRQPSEKNRCAGLSGCCVHMCLPVPSISDQALGTSCWCPGDQIAEQETNPVSTVSLDLISTSSSTAEVTLAELAEFTTTETETSTATTTSMTSTAGITPEVNMDPTTPLTTFGSTNETPLVATTSDCPRETLEWPYLTGFIFLLLINMTFLVFAMIYLRKMRKSINRMPFVTYSNKPDETLSLVYP